MNAYSTDTSSYVKSHLLKALLGGFAGTLVFHHDGEIHCAR